MAWLDQLSGSLVTGGPLWSLMTVQPSAPKPSASDILACDDFNTAFAQLVAGSSFADVLVLSDGVKVSDPGIRRCYQLDVTLSNQALRSGAPVQIYLLTPLTWAAFQDMYKVGAACNRLGIGPP
jgi:hypothetical protein